MGITVGPADWWVASPDAINGMAISCPEGTILPDGTVVICRAGGCAWIVAPSITQVGQTWNGTTNTQVGVKCCVCDWSTLNTQLINCGFNPGDWFVPSQSQLQNPGFVCRCRWDTFSATNYWSSAEISATSACVVSLPNGNTASRSKTEANCVRAFRCVTY